MRCSKCGSENPAGKRFCGDCGVPLEDGAPIPTREPRGPLQGERRHLTVLFCDLVNSTSIATRLDPEEWREIVADYHRAAAQAIEQFGGSVAQYLGDGVMAYFGWPEAHENDAERAARAGLAILESISRLNEKSLHAELVARVGIHSGAVVVGTGVSKEADVFGDVPSIANRVQSIAEPGTVLITGDTHRLVSGLFEVEGRGAQRLKGIEQPVELCQVIQPRRMRRRLSVGPGLTPFAGREAELSLLLSRWERVRHREGQVVMVLGEPGIGKSRLIRQFHERIACDQHIWIESDGDQFAQTTPFHAVIEMLRQRITPSHIESAEGSVEQLAQSLEAAGLTVKQALPLIAPLLNLAVPKNYPPVPAAPEEQRRRLLASLCHWAIGIAEAQPAIIVLEDLQWADASTVELAKLLVEQGASATLMQIYTARSGFECPWPARPQLTQLTLDRLSDHEAREIVWYPWGAEAFAKARREKKPIFLSIGYSTCYWCHVAERIIYSNPEIAKFMNQWFVNIKVDREQLPDVDRVYMLATELMTGQGGWPNNLFLTPDLKPFFAGSYFSPADFTQILNKIHQIWTSDPERIVASANEVFSAMQRSQMVEAGAKESPISPEAWMGHAQTIFMMRLDPQYGGITSEGPKFPQESTIELMLEDYRLHHNPRVRQWLTTTLDAMAYGGIWDHLGNGFHRYSTEPTWSIPHFEKMLYDNVQLLQNYAEAYRETSSPLYRQIALGIGDFLGDQMMMPDGGFFTAQDSEVAGVEGSSYVWTRKQIESVLGAKHASDFFQVYQLTPMPNQLSGLASGGEDAGVIRIRLPIAATLKRTGRKDVPAMLLGLAPLRQKLLIARDRRPQPARDEKIGVALNGLTIEALAESSKILNQAQYVSRA